MATTNFQVPLSEHLTATLALSIKVSKETRAQAQREGIDPEALENLMEIKMQEIVDEVASLLKVERGEDF